MLLFHDDIVETGFKTNFFLKAAFYIYSLIVGSSLR